MIDKKPSKPTVAIIGAGAVGGAIAARTVQSGMDVVVIGRDEAWLRGIRREGLTISGAGARKKFTLRPPAFTPAVRPKRSICDLVLICVKSQDTASATARMAPLLGPETAIVSVQNGLTHMRPIVSRFGKKRTVFGITIIAANRPRRFHVRHEGGDEIFLAPHDGNGEAVTRSKQILELAGWKIRMAPSEDRLLWTKAAFNACTNPIGALTGKTNGELIGTPALAELVYRSLREAIRAASMAGHSPLYGFNEMKKVIESKTVSDQPNSMLQDIRAGRRTEADAILAPILAAARRAKTPAPTLNSLYRFIKRLEKELLR